MKFTSRLTQILSILLLFLSLSWSGSSFHSQINANASTPQFAKIFVDSPTQVAELANLGLDIAEVQTENGYVVVLLSEADLEKIKTTYRYEILNEKKIFYLEETYDKYHDNSQIEQILRNTEKNYPNICKLHQIGTSIENRPIWAIQVTSNVNVEQKKPTVLIDGLHHAREWIAGEVPLTLLKELTEKYATSSTIKDLVDNCETWIIPVVNPDGFEYSHKQQQMWRKNRRKNSNNSYGVDLNRNYGYQWGNVGASNNPNDETYHGTGPFSEPCTVTIKNLVAAKKFRTALSFHSYSGLVLYPYGYSSSAVAPDNTLLSNMAKEMAQLTQYTAKKCSSLYPTMGGSIDYLYGEAGVLAFAIELGKSSFIPPDSEVDQICADNLKACLYLIDKAKTEHAYNHPDFVKDKPLQPAASF